MTVRRLAEKDEKYNKVIMDTDMKLVFLNVYGGYGLGCVDVVNSYETLCNTKCRLSVTQIIA